MFVNYVKIALRHLRRNKLYALLNIAGLAIGLACGIVVFRFVATELSYDQFHENAERIYRVTYDEYNSPAQRHLATVSPPMGPTLRAEYAEVEQFVRLRDSDRQVFSRGDRRFYEADFFYADSSFFDVFGFSLRRGNPEKALAAANTIVLSEETAHRYFDDVDPMGKTIRMNDEVDLTVTGILSPPAGRSHLQFDFLISFSTFRVPFGYPVTLDDWGWISFHTYVLLRDGADANALEAKLPDFMRRHLDERRATTARLRLQPVTDIYLGRPTHPEMAAGSPVYVAGLSAAAILILFLACFNFAILSTAQSIRRRQEVGMRKTLGARRGDLIRQHLGESVLMALLALAPAILLSELGLAAGNRWLDLNISSDLAGAAPIFVLIAVVTGLVAGSYPALVLSNFRPAHVFKGDVGVSKSRFRDGLIVLQLAVAVVLVAGGTIIAQQMDYVRAKELGFEEERIIALHMQGSDLLARYDRIEERLRSNPHVVSVTKSGDLFDGNQGSVPIFAEGAGEEPVRAMPIYGMYYDFFETMEIDVLEGRAPDRSMISDSVDAIVINQKAAEVLAATVPGWEQPLGRSLRVSNIMEGRVIGVVENFHFASLHTEIDPLILYFPRTAIDKVLVRVHPGSIDQILASLEQDWQAVAADFPFTFDFLDEHIDHLYRSDRRFARLVGLFMALTLIVACMGLYGLVAFTARLRAKEIGIRKVLGASIPKLTGMLASRFVAYGALANLVALPLAYVGIRGWLDNFAYHIEPGVGTFLLAGIVTLAIALGTVTYEATRAAAANPVESLRRD